MTGLLLCVLAAGLTFFFGWRRSLGHGFSALVAVGYSYGLLRARYPDGFSHFMFDAAVVALYLAMLVRPATTAERWRQRPVRPWLHALIGWPMVMVLLPLQHPLIQLVGLRAVVLFLPLLLVGVSLAEADLYRIARSLAWLNLGAFVIALLEFNLGIERFFPYNQVTDIIYRSNDLAGHTAYRIPATFPNAHAYAGTMVATFPFLIALWQQPDANRRTRHLAGLAVVASALGIFMTGARQPTGIFLFLVGILVVSVRLRARSRAGLLAAALLVGVVVMRSERLQRFTTLTDTEMVADRFVASANREFLEIMAEYPLGAGLGRAAGTSIPFFLSRYAEPQIGMENEYGRILVELGTPGLLLWLAFLGWIVTRPRGSLPPSWRIAERMVFFYVAVSWGTAFIGTGVLSSIPATALLLVEMGMLVRQREPSRAPETALATARSHPLVPLVLGSRRSIPVKMGRSPSASPTGDSAD